MESIRNFGKYVIPYFKKRAGEQVQTASSAG